jgi:hypothetical protein
VVLLTAYVGVQGRLYEMAALRVAGVPTGVLRRAVLREYRLLLGAPLLVGFLAGALGAVLMLPGVPLVTVGVTGGALTYRPGPGVLPVAIVDERAGFHARRPDGRPAAAPRDTGPATGGAAMIRRSIGTSGGSFDLPLCISIGSGKPNTCQGGKVGPASHRRPFVSSGGSDELVRRRTCAGRV